MKAWKDVIEERLRQIHDEGWELTHDDQYTEGQLALAAACYALEDMEYWPWVDAWWKPTHRRGNLVKAAALLIAEIERLDRYGNT